MERILNEPVLLLVVAAAVIAFGIDLGTLSEAVNKLIDIGVLIAGAGLARQQVTPMRKLEDE